MGKLIATTQATLDGVIDPVGEWVEADGDHGEYSFERQARSRVERHPARGGPRGLGPEAEEGGRW